MIHCGGMNCRTGGGCICVCQQCTQVRAARANAPSARFAAPSDEELSEALGSLYGDADSDAWLAPARMHLEQAVECLARVVDDDSRHPGFAEIARARAYVLAVGALQAVKRITD